MRKANILMALFLLLVAVACAVYVEPEVSAPTPNVEAIEYGWHRLCDGFRYTAWQGERFVCANSFRDDGDSLVLFASTGRNAVAIWSYYKGAVLLINAEGGTFTFQ